MIRTRNFTNDWPVTPNFKRLLADARAGCVQSQEWLFGDYVDQLKSLTRKTVRGQLRKKIDPEDLAQEVLADAYRQFDQFQGNSELEFQTWLGRILDGHMAALYRHYFTTKSRDVRREELLGETIVVALASTASMAVSPSSRAVQREEAAMLAAALDSLPEDYKQVIMLRHVDGKSFQEVADAMSRSVDSVQKLWVRGLTKLRIVLEKRLG